MITLIGSLMTCDELIFRSMKESNPNKKVFLASEKFSKSRDPLQPKKLNPVIFGSEKNLERILIFELFSTTLTASVSCRASPGVRIIKSYLHIRGSNYDDLLRH